MLRQIRHHNSTKIGLSVIVMFGVLALAPPKGMTIFPKGHSHTKFISEKVEHGPIIIEGKTTRVQGEFVGKDFSQMRDQSYTVESAFGRTWDVYLEKKSPNIEEIDLGDHVKAKVNNEGTVQVLQKVSVKKTDSSHAVVRRVQGKVQKRDGNFLFVEDGENTLILHLDHNTTSKGNIRKGSRVVAQLGEAGYVINIQESR
ncbi:hypothetical protein [Candidatus Nitrospira salsa]